MTPPGKRRPMLYLNNKDALLAGFATAKAPHITYGLHAGKLHVRVFRHSERYKGEHLYSAVCVVCGYDSNTQLSLGTAKAAGEKHVAECTGVKA
jgi:hypothetical protein